MAFYVPLGPRGVLLRVGTFLIGIMGGMVYRVASSRRAMGGTAHQPLTIPLPD
jgi:hypothetical protein